MKKNISIFSFTILLLCGGCASGYLSPISTCQPLSAYKTIVVAPIDGDTALVEESKYRHLPHDIALAATEKLKEGMEFNSLFPKVLQSSVCVDNAVRIEGKIYSLVHYKRSFHLGVRGGIIDCEIITPFIYSNMTKRILKVLNCPFKLRIRLVDGIRARLTGVSRISRILGRVRGIN